MSAQVPGSLRRSAAPIAAMLALPAILFYAVLFRFAVNIPTLDDYDAALDFVDRMSQTSGLLAKAVLFFSTQHNEYKTLFGNAIFWLQYSVFGQVNFRLSSAVGNFFTVLIGVVLWKMFLPRAQDRTTRLALFVPVCWLLFQLNFAESLDAPMTALAWLPTLTFCFAAIYLLTRGGGKDFTWALVWLVLGIFSSTNGFIVVPIGALILILARRYARLAGWLGVTAGCMALYLFHYARAANHGDAPPAGGLLQHSLLLKPVFVLCVLGDAVGYPLRLTGSAALGLALCVAFVLLARRGFFGRNPAIGYCVLFLVLTAMGIATIRSGFGIEGSLSSRYRMYSDLLLIFAWMGLVEELILSRAGQLTGPLRRNWLYVAAVAATVLFALGQDVWGYRFLRSRFYYWTEGVAAYEHPAYPGSTEGPVLRLAGQDAVRDESDRYAREVFARSVELGVYRPPQYPAMKAGTHGPPQ